MNLAALTDLATQLGAFGVAVLVIWLLMTERLVPRSRLNEKQKQVDDRATELQLERARHDRSP